MTSDIITATCAAHFGARARRYRDNRCDACPLRAPCIERGRVPGTSSEQLAEGKRVFVEAAMRILEGM